MSEQTSASLHGLRPITQRPTLREYLRELADRREYVRAVPLSEIRVKHLDTVLGNVWFLVNPLMQTAVYFLIFGVLLEIDRGVENYPVFLVIGVLVFRLFSQSVSGGANSMRRNETLMRSLYFPRAIIPVSSALANFYMFLPGVLIMIALVLFTGEGIALRWLALPVVLVIALVFVMGGTLITARLGHIFPDLSNVLPHITRLLFYGSGVIYQPESFTQNENALLLFDINPMFQLVSLARWSLMGQPISQWFWITAPLYAVVTLLFGFIYFWRNELSYGSAR